jgi:hypothetical protein
MDHVFMLASDTCELESLSDGTRSMIIRGSHEALTRFQYLKKDDLLYFIRDDREGEIEASGVVSCILISGKLSEEESYEFVIRNQDKLQLPDDQFYKWAGKPYLVLIGIEYFRHIHLNLAETDQHLPFLIPKAEAK